ncbi:MAG: glycosyltransferase N-terminal domain-containing protein [Sulfitobacter sp.]
MARSLGLTAYRALVRRGEAHEEVPMTQRPSGELVWIHAAEAGNMIAVQDLATRLCANRIGLNVLITVAEDAFVAPPQSAALEGLLIVERIPTEHPKSVAAFLDHWKPDTCIWTWGALRPNLILAAVDQGCPLFLIDADTKGFDGRRDRWLPDLTRDLLTHFSAVLTRSDAGLRRLVQLGLPRPEIEVTSPLLAGGQALQCADSDLTELSAALGGRPVWFAAQVSLAEVPIVLTAHRQALRLSHRLLLILHPADPGDVEATIDQATSRDFNLSQWNGVTHPDDATQVMIAEDTADLGLFYRVAPVSFLGSSLISDQGGFDPFEAAALGSAVLYGPKVRRFMPSYTRLAAAGAARIVNDADALGTAVSRLIAPDQAAAMAHAGWDVISQGAELTDRVIDLVQDALDSRVGRS